MREAERIDRIIELLKELWKKNPDLRFGQMLIDFGIAPDCNIWFIEDDDWEKHLREELL